MDKLTEQYFRDEISEIKEKSLEGKKHICTLGFGVGLSWAGAMIDI